MLRNRIKMRPLVFFAVVFIWVSCLAGAQKTANRTSPELTQAKIQLEHGDLDASEKTLWAVLATDPSNEQALSMLGVIRARQERYPEAEALFRRVLQLDPKAVAASTDLAEALLAQNKNDDAIEQYKQTIRLVPQDLDLKIKVAKLDLAQGNFAEALSTLDTIESKKIPPPVVPLKAASLLGLGRKADAERLIPLVKTYPALSLELAQIFLTANDPDAALACLALVDPPAKTFAARAYYLKGRALRQKEENAAAMTSFRRSVAAAPKSSEPLIAMAEVLASENKHSESLAILQKAQLLSPASPEILRHIIFEAMKSGENDKAVQAAEDLQHKSSAPDDRYLVATVLIQQKQYVPATHLLEDYIAQRPDDAKAYLGLGIAYLNLLRYSEAQDALTHSLQIEPQLAESEYQLGVLLAQQGSRQEAIQHWRKAVELQPHHAQAQFSLGTIYLEDGELEKARNSFLHSLADDPKNMKTEYNLALVLNKLGETEQAKEHFDRYRKMQDEEHVSSGNPPTPSDHP